MRNGRDDDAVLEEALLRLERDVGGKLDSWAEAEWADIAAAERRTSAEEREQAVRAFQKLASPRAAAFPFRGFLLTAAAGMLGGVLCGWMLRAAVERKPERGSPVLMGEARGSALAPDGTVERYDRFAWTAPAGRGQLYGLRVWSGGGYEPVLRKDGLTEPAYTPSAEEAALLGAQIRWEVVLQDAGGGFAGLWVTASASRR